MKRTNIYLDEKERKILRLMAVENETTMSALIRQAISEFLNRQKERELIVQNKRSNWRIDASEISMLGRR